MAAVAPNFHMTSPPFNPQAPAFTPLADGGLRAEAAEFVPTLGGGDAPRGAAEATRQKRQMPDATDEEWETRIMKREKEVETIKSLQSYRLYVEVFPRDVRDPEDPKTPDAKDRSVSKRMWKWNVEKWRLLLKSRCAYSRTVMLQSREYMHRVGAVDTDHSGAVLAVSSRDEGSRPQPKSEEESQKPDAAAGASTQEVSTVRIATEVETRLASLANEAFGQVCAQSAERAPPAALDLPEPPGIAVVGSRHPVAS